MSSPAKRNQRMTFLNLALGFAANNRASWAATDQDVIRYAKTFESFVNEEKEEKKETNSSDVFDDSVKIIGERTGLDASTSLNMLEAGWIFIINDQQTGSFDYFRPPNKEQI